MNSLRRGEVGRGEIRNRLGLSGDGLFREDFTVPLALWRDRLHRTCGAYHEVGHAWVATHLGWRVDGLDLEETETRAGRTYYTYQERTQEQLAMFAMAGKIAQRLVLPRSWYRWVQGETNDVSKLREQLSEMGCADADEQTELMRRAERRLRKLLISARDELDFLAAHLLESGRLSGDTFRYLRNAYAEVIDAGGQ